METAIERGDERGLAVRLGFWTALATAGTAAVALAIAITTPPRSGPYCSGGCIGAPYTDAAAFVPRDYLWMYPAALLTLLLIVLVACLADWVDSRRRVLGRIGSTFSTIGAAVLLIDYAIQLTVLQPALVRGQTDGLAPWTQYNPFGVFIGLENVGYAVLNLGFLALGVALTGLPTRLERAAGVVLIVGGGLTWVALVLYSVVYRAQLDYRFEVMAIFISWLVLIAAPALLALVFARSGHRQRSRVRPGLAAVP